jgi:D-alanyl-D-alanine carboxypeptidase
VCSSDLSGYRDYATQAMLYEEAVDEATAQPPGHSEHHSGLAIDVGAFNISSESLGTSREGVWLAENVGAFGLIVRYPADKQAVTGIAYEPWHLRYIGQPHARYCQDNGLAFEEYLEFLKEEGGYQMRYKGSLFNVWYQIPTDGILKVPANGQFTVSSDNTGGYIVTAWE